MPYRTALLVLLLFAWPLLADHPEAVYAVVRIPSHGCSATIIATEPGRTLLLGCGHAYQGADRHKPMVFDIPAAVRQAPKQVGSRLVDVDYRADLSLVELQDGPLPYVAPVAKQSGNHVQLVSCGYDGMELPGSGPFRLPVTAIAGGQGLTYTREKPRHGRSGGGLIDLASGELVGTCVGYETDRNGRGMYTSLAAIQAFLDRQGSRVGAPNAGRYLQPRAPLPSVPCPT